MIRRKNYLIKKRFQVNFIAKFIGLLIVESALIIGLFVHISNNTLTTGYSGSVLTVEKTSQFFLASFVLMALIVAIGISIAGMVMFILLSHRIAGPLFRFERALKEIEEGDLTARIALRKSDQLTELKEALNGTIGTLDKRIGKIKHFVDDIYRTLDRMGEPESSAKLKKTVELLKKETDLFKATPGLKEKA